MDTIYLDNAATSFPKPNAVTDEVARCMREYCGNPGRGGHPLAMAAAEKIFECREVLADFFGAPDPSGVIFTQNCTSALNLAIKGSVHEGWHFVTSDLEHNSVRRPLERLSNDGIADYTRFSLLADIRGRSVQRILNGIAGAVRQNTRAIIVTAGSNICSVPVPLFEIGQFCRRHGLLFIVDGAQAAGHIPIDMKQMNIDILALPGHKGLFGPQGSGALIIGEDIKLRTLYEGGSGSASFDPDMPEDPPERYEAGTLSTPAIAGLCEGVKAVKQMGVEYISAHEKKLFLLTRNELSCIPGCVLYAAEHPGSVLTFNLRGIPCDRVACELGMRGICVRAGIHCAPWAHEALGSIDGSVRVSFSPFNTERDAEVLCSAVRDIRNAACLNSN